MTNRTWSFRLSVAANLFTVALNVFIIVGDLFGHRYRDAGIQSLVLAAPTVVLYLLYVGEERRAVWRQAMDVELDIRRKVLAKVDGADTVSVDQEVRH